MTEINIPAFALGVVEELYKKSFLVKEAYDVNTMPLNENIIPTLKGQTKWKYVRTKDGLKLTDGNLVYSFGGLPSDYPHDDARVSRLDDDNILNFERDALQKGTAQIHRASPDNIYMTLADGAQNPTFMLQHEEGKNWRYSPSKKFMQKLKAMREALPPTQEENINIEEKALTDGAVDQLKIAGWDIVNPIQDFNAGWDSKDIGDMIVNAKDKMTTLGKKYVHHHAAQPIKAIVEGMLLDKYVLAPAIRPIRNAIFGKPKEHTSHSLFGEILPEVAPVVASMALEAK
jgi:hypothetical protein